MPFDCCASFAASARRMSMPTALIRSITAAAEVARTGLMTELISGGAPSPSSPWHPRQFMRYRSDPCRVTISFAGSAGDPNCQGDYFPFPRAQSLLAVASAAIHAVQVRSVQSHNFIRGLRSQSQLPANQFRLRRGRGRPQSSRLAHAGFVERPAQVRKPTLTADARRHGTRGLVVPTCNRPSQRRGFEYNTGHHEERDSPSDDGKKRSPLPHVGELQSSQLEPVADNGCHAHVLFLSISCPRIRVTEFGWI